MGHSDDFEFEFQNQGCKEIAGNYVQETIQGISFVTLSIEYRIWNPKSDTLTHKAGRDFKSFSLSRVTDDNGIQRHIIMF